MNALSHSKSALRKQARNILRNHSANEFLVAGVKVARHIDRWLLSSTFKFVNRAVGSFSSLKDEIIMTPLDILLEQHGFILCRPEVVGQTEMVFRPQLNLDIIFVPGLAFDRHGHRLGRGYGFYDRFLSGLDRGAMPPILMGLAMDAQMSEDVPVEEHDVAMDYICTPSQGVLHCA